MDVDRKPLLVKIRREARLAFLMWSKSMHVLNELGFKIFSFCSSISFWFSMLNLCTIQLMRGSIFSCPMYLSRPAQLCEESCRLDQIQTQKDSSLLNTSFNDPVIDNHSVNNLGDNEHIYNHKSSEDVTPKGPNVASTQSTWLNKNKDPVTLEGIGKLFRERDEKWEKRRRRRWQFLQFTVIFYSI